MKRKQMVVSAGILGGLGGLAGLAAVIVAMTVGSGETPAAACGQKACDTTPVVFQTRPTAPSSPPLADGAPSSTAGRDGLQPLAVLRQEALANPRDAGKWRALATAHHRKGEFGIAWQALKRAAILDRKWAGSDEGVRLMRQYGSDARSVGTKRSGR